MENYNRIISSKMLGNIENMIDNIPQPTLFGGKRQRDFVLPSSTNYSYPASLSVGHLGSSGIPKTLGTTFWTDFGETNFLQDKEDDPVEGGAYHIGATGEVYRSTQLPSKMSKVKGGKMSAKKLFKDAVPIAKDFGMILAKEGIKQGVKEGFKAKQGGKMSAKKLFKDASPIAKDFGMILAKEGIKEGVKEGFKAKQGGRVTKEFFEAEKQLLPKGKKALEEFLKGAGYDSGSSSDEECEDELGYAGSRKSGFIQAMVGKKPSVSKYGAFNLSKIKDPSNDLINRYGRPKKKGGVLLRDVPAEFHSSVYPPALQSYTAGKGGARPKSARGAIVSEIMKKHGLSLPEASKYVKQHNLY